MNDKFIQVFLDSRVSSKAELFHFIAGQANGVEQELLTELLVNRETVGSTLIADQIILPHLESDKVEKSQILFISLEEPIDWDEATGKVKLAIAILLKSDEEQEIKQQITRFTRTLADEEYLEDLANEKELASFYKKIREF
ncbi:PTS sugar transporter subunit IIA [Candidatus Enterococcus clewellii]|uniref:PTS EIIA type-2 domain-containing protein n=1 Tax=Candidatus Enterococcus clewellii TaxID=1834193 RepID=A0A242KDR8_9ENTE|nr:PTS sugar transporter subunit IIA [Enterococcus sp. 9E7_DIV0242]OTP19106.1 hypothetical protein A5888_000920 [Enterococcus sp. 9E7_DIV0242]